MVRFVPHLKSNGVHTLRRYVGRTVSHYWSKEQHWYYAEVMAYEERSGVHLLKYAVDGESHWVYLCMEEFRLVGKEEAAADHAAEHGATAAAAGVPAQPSYW
jgi:adenosylcobinamide amidohydrolase